MNIRNLSVVCLLVALFMVVTRKLRYIQQYSGSTIKMEDGSRFEIFRHISCFPPHHNDQSCVFIVSFKFSRLSHRANKIASIIPMLLIAGFPGFISKAYAVNHQNGYWQGIYQWRSARDLEEYQRSFVFRMMNKRAVPGTLKSVTLEDHEISTYFENHKALN